MIVWDEYMQGSRSANSWDQLQWPHSLASLASRLLHCHTFVYKTSDGTNTANFCIWRLCGLMWLVGFTRPFGKAMPPCICWEGKPKQHIWLQTVTHSHTVPASSLETAAHPKTYLPVARSSICLIQTIQVSHGFSSQKAGTVITTIASYLAREQKHRKTFSIPLQFPCLSLRSFSSCLIKQEHVEHSNAKIQSEPPRQAWLVMSLARPGTNGTDSLNPHNANGIHLFGVLAKLFPNVPSKFEPQKDLWNLDFKCFFKLGLKPVFVCYLLVDNLLSKTLFSERSCESTREIQSESMKTKVINPLLGSFGII